MDDYNVLRGANYLLHRKGIKWDKPLTVHNFGTFREYVADCVRYCLDKRDFENHPWIPDWSVAFARFGDEFDIKIKQDPLLLYQPRTDKHAAFHISNAYIRYLIAGNGIGKTLLAYVEDIWCATGQMHWKHNRGNVAVVSTGHSVYSEKTFWTKMITGEDGDPYSPYLPEGGKWLHSYDQRKYILNVACKDCAENGLTKKCTHTKSIHCLSADSGVDRMMGFTVRLYHIDEHVPHEIAKELHQRARRGGADGRGIVTATPLAGPDSWEVRELYTLATEHPEKNYLNTDRKDIQYVEIFNISKYDCVGSKNGPTLGEIEADRLKMPTSEFKARVLGEPVPISDNPVFDTGTLDAIEKEHCREPLYFSLSVKGMDGPHSSISTVSAELLNRAADVMPMQVHNIKKHKEFSGVRLWAYPETGAQYAIGVDSALGPGASSEKRDASYAPVFKIQSLPNDNALLLEQVAAWWGYFDIYEYAKQVKLLAYWYNRACVIPETTGIGGALTTALVRQLNYPGVYVGENDGRETNADVHSKFGINTNAETKQKIIAAAHNFVKSNLMIIRDKEAIGEFRTYQSTLQPSGNYKYEAAKGAHDDRVMGAALVCYACRTNPISVLSLSQPPIEAPAPLGPNRVPGFNRPRRLAVKLRYI